jgi:hypothetical protein
MKRPLQPGFTTSVFIIMLLAAALTHAETAVSVAAGSDHACAVTTSGAVRCWGDNGAGELGDGTTTDSSTPVDVIGFGAFAAAKNDFDGDSKSDVLFLNTSTGAVRYWNDASKSQSIYVGTYDHADYSYAGSGDFDGDGKADLLFTKASNRATLVWSGAVKTAATYPRYQHSRI